MTDRHQQKPYPLRMPNELRARLEEAAQEGSRSLHAEIVTRLQASFETATSRESLNAAHESGHEQLASTLPPALLQELERLFDERLGGVTAVIHSADGLKKEKLVLASKIEKNNQK